MSSTNFNDFTTPAIPAAWLNDVNLLVYQLAGNGASAPLNDSDVKNNLGIPADIAAGDATTLAAANAAAVALPGRLLGIQRFTANGTYTPSAGTVSIIGMVIGGGGAGGGSPVTGPAVCAAGAGGGSGACTWFRMTSGFSGLAVVIGAGGTGVVGGGGGNGGTSSFGTITAPGGQGGTASGASGVGRASGGNGGVAGVGGNITNTPGTCASWAVAPQPYGVASPGASSDIGGGGTGTLNGTGGAAQANSGAGGGGAGNDQNTAVAFAGGAGGSGLVIIYEYS